MVVIASFKDKFSQAFYEGVMVQKWYPIRMQISCRLQILDSATCLNDLKSLPSNRFKVLKGDRKEQYSIRVNKQWRICFCWKDEGPYAVEIVDYH